MGRFMGGMIITGGDLEGSICFQQDMAERDGVDNFMNIMVSQVHGFCSNTYDKIRECVHPLLELGHITQKTMAIVGLFQGQYGLKDLQVLVSSNHLENLIVDMDVDG